MPPEIFDRHSRRLLEASETETKQVSQLFDWYSQLFDLFLPNYLGQFTHLSFSGQMYIDHVEIKNEVHAGSSNGSALD